MYIEGTPVYHMVDDATHFNAAQFVETLTTEYIKRIHTYVMGKYLRSVTEHIIFDYGSQFRNTFVEICKVNDVEWQRSGTQHYSALGI